MPDLTRVALATSSALPELDEPERAIIPALAACGIEGVPAVWTDTSTDWSTFAAVVIRTTWDYTDRHIEFVEWCDRVESDTTLLNSAAMVRWNSDKRYLEDLVAAGVPAVPTLFVAPGTGVSTSDVAAMLEVCKASDVVVKPSVSASSRDTFRFRHDANCDLGARIAGIHAASKTAMVQPYIDGVDDTGETAMLFAGGEFSHGAHKKAMLARGAAHPNDEAIFTRQPTPEEHEIAAEVMDWVTNRFGVPTYARVDLLPGSTGPLVIEVELVEPSWFMEADPGSPARFAAAIAAELHA